MDIFIFVLSIIIIVLLFFVVIFKKKLNKANQLLIVQESNNTNLRKEYDNLNVKYKHLQVESKENYNRLCAEITEKKRLIEDIEKAKSHAEESDILKSNFLANMSHEIRTPMNGIMGFAQLLKGEEDKERCERYIDIIYHNGTVLVNLIDDIIDISKIDAGQLSINKSKCNIDDLMFEVYSFFNEMKFKQEKDHINLRLLNLNDDESNTIFTDEKRLRQVLVNLIGNAIKFTEIGSIDFGYIVKNDEKVIQFFVRDTGIGIPDNKRDIIFERFRQVQEGSTRKYGGTGIGLYISKCIIEMLGGRIWFDSKLGAGTTFYFTVPFSDVSSYTEPILPSIDDHIYMWHNKKILIAEDVETNFKYLKTILTSTNATIIWARNGKDAVEMVTNDTSINIVLMDIQMPIMDGYEATSLIRQINTDIPIIAQTAFALPHDNIKCFDAGCTDYMSKPINASLLKQKINKYLNN